MAALRATSFAVEPPRTVRVPGFAWDHEVRVALPLSYSGGTRSYPVLWITGNQLEKALSVLWPLDLILVAIGCGPDVSSRELKRQMLYDITPPGSWAWDGAGGDTARAYQLADNPEWAEPGATGGAEPFLDFLAGDLRSTLVAEYRMSDDHGLIGVSGGGMFVGYALFARPGAFTRYICGSPIFNLGHGSVFELEEAYAAAHDDLAAHVYICAGEAEMTEGVMAAFEVVSSMAKLVERLTFRAYPSLQLTARIFAGEPHGSTMWPNTLGHGVRAVWGDAISPGHP